MSGEREPVTDINDPEFFSDENLDLLGEPAGRGDYMLGPNEDASTSTGLWITDRDRPMALPEREQI